MAVERPRLPLVEMTLDLMEPHDMAFVAQAIEGFISRQPVRSSPDYDWTRQVLGSLREELLARSSDE